jgi:prepilin-type N-terminal cleavage/methylation domain-containing protein
MQSHTKKLTKGFTIIEVLIVLAIAGLILAIVFLAVPALQRNSRNNSRITDASHLVGLINDYVANHGGQLPTSVGTGGNDLNVSTESWAIMNAPVTANIDTTGDTDDPWGDLDTLVVRNNFRCNGNDNTLTGQARAFSVTFQVETSGNPLNRCVAG